MTSRRILYFLFSTFLFAAPAFAQSSPRAKELGGKLLCVCGCNQILTACNHVGCTYSHNMLKELDDRISRGESDSLILQSFVQEYGPTVLAEPPARGFNWAAWIMPVLVPLIALFLVWQLVRRWRARSVPAAAGGAPAISPELLSRARRDIDKDLDA
jgi:cytochrome c-type biogenesis protein CcmH